MAIALAIGPVTILAPPADAAPIAVVAVAAPGVEGLRYESHSIFTLDLAAHAVHVQVSISITNTQPSYTSGGFIHQFYFPKIGVPVLSEAANFNATRDGAPLTVTPEDTSSAQFKIAAIALKPALFYPQSQNLEFDYDLPGQAPRSASLTRVNDAFSSFIAFGFGDPGITTVQINVPSSLTTEIVGEDMKSETHGDVTTYTADNLTDPETWTASVDARNDAQLVQKQETVDGRKIVIKGWPDDSAWVDFVDGQLKNGLPALEKLIGQPWPDASKDLTVTETAAPYLYGYSCWYIPLKNSIEIGDALDALVVLHEISHTWFNTDMFVDRWISEGFANEFAARALEKIGQPLQSPDPVTPDSAGAIKLNDWSKPRLQDSSTTDEEKFGYAASWTILRALSTEIGMDKLKLVIDAASHKLIAYSGHPAPEQSVNSTDWKRLLDLFEEVGGSKGASDLFKQYVVGEGDAALFAQRTDARAAYRKFVDGSGGWSAPLAVRSAMGEWEFARAASLITDAQTALHLRDQIADTLRPLGRGAPPSLQQHYESQGGSDLQPVIDEANRDLDAAHHIVDANHAVHASHGVIGTFGLLFAGAADKVHKAENALEKGDAAAAISLADSARRQANDATKTGVIRLVVLLLVIASAYALWTWGRPFARRKLEARAQAKREAAQRAEAQRLEESAPWAPPPPPYFPMGPPPSGESTPPWATPPPPPPPLVEPPPPLFPAPPVPPPPSDDDES
jgi:hypothetical protein